MRFPHRQLAKHNRVEQAEERGIGPNRERQRSEHDEREAGSAAKHPRRIADVMPQRVDSLDDARTERSASSAAHEFHDSMAISSSELSVSDVRRLMAIEGWL
jgi:hypothetical protein